MKKKQYHHGNLKNDLIEKGLELIDKYGVESLSMRKLAEKIGVSNAAPYAHFENKEAFLDSIQEYITNKLTNVLKDICDHCNDNSRIILELGKGYICFFYNNPLYYQFLFIRRTIDISTYPPYVLFKTVASKILEEKYKGEISTKNINNKIIVMWAMVHGLSQANNIKSIISSDDIEKEIEDILCSIEI